MLSQFALDVQVGLSASPKYLSSKYFYDDKGSQIFQQIMDLPEYYLTRCEFEILSNHCSQLSEILGNDYFEMVELGAGDGLKTKILLKEFLQQKLDFQYLAIDISEKALSGLEIDLQTDLPSLKTQFIQSEYFAGLNSLKSSNYTKLVLFLGSNIGNFQHKDAINFLKEIRRNLQVNDFLLIGFDLQKNPASILAAYNDAQGITREFNLNLLKRMNQELGANFLIDNYLHYPIYDPYQGVAKSYLISKTAQIIDIQLLNQSFSLEAWEAIHTEVSHKYTLNMIAEMAEMAGFQIIRNFQDTQNYFCDSLWQVK